MYVVGLGGSSHDHSSCLLKDGRIVTAIEDERLSRKKQSYGYDPTERLSLRYCLANSQVSLTDVDVIVAPLTNLSREERAKLRNNAPYDPLRRVVLTPDSPINPYRDLPAPVHIVDHHYAHAASAYYISPYEHAAVLVVDHTGDMVDDQQVEALTYWLGTGPKLQPLGGVHGKVASSMRPNHSLGNLYQRITKIIGCDSLMSDNRRHSQAGKTMGLAAYGTDRFYAELMEFVRLLPEGQFKVDIEPNGLDAWAQAKMSQAPADSDQNFQWRADLAWAAQTALEEIMVHCAKHLWDLTRVPNLCLAGGVALNGLTNARLLRETPFRNLFIQPAAGDAGLCIGAAYIGYHAVCGQPRDPHQVQRAHWRNAYLGRVYEDELIASAIADCQGIVARRTSDVPAITAQLVAAGNVVGFFQGGSEFGPRALGHRTILADPRDPHMRDHLNFKVKHREHYRPLAPAALHEHSDRYFEGTHPSPFMLQVVNTRPEKRREIPAVVHVDGTARVQTVTREDNDLFYAVIEAFFRLTGVPMVLNTSYNGQGEPICETPQEALQCFLATRMDYLVLHDWLISRASK